MNVTYGVVSVSRTQTSLSIHVLPVRVRCIFTVDREFGKRVPCPVHHGRWRLWKNAGVQKVYFTDKNSLLSAANYESSKRTFFFQRNKRLGPREFSNPTKRSPRRPRRTGRVTTPFETGTGASAAR